MKKIIIKSIALTIVLIVTFTCIPIAAQGKTPPLSNAKCRTEPVKYATYTGHAVKPTVYVLRKDNLKRLKQGTDFTVSYKNNVTVGHKKKAITIKFIGSYKGLTALKPDLVIEPRAPKINKISYNKNTRKLTVKFSKYKETSKTLFVLQYTSGQRPINIVTKKKYISGNSYTTPKLKLSQSYKLYIYGVTTLNNKDLIGQEKNIKFTIRRDNKFVRQ